MVQKLSLLFIIGTSIIMQTACSVDPTDDDEKKESSDASEKKIELKTLKDSASYALGVNIVQNFRNQKLESKLDKEIFIAAVEKQFASEENLMDMQKSSMLIRKYISQSSKQDNSGKIEEGKKFLEENAKRDEVKVTDSGLQYEIIKEGSGESPTATSKVKTHYEGRLIDGTKFDSSYDRGKPATFPVNGVIKGWQEALQLMKPGAKWKLYIPYDLAYGERGQGKVIGPYETLIFDIELIEIVE